MSDREYLLDIMCDELRRGVPAGRSYFDGHPIGGRRKQPETTPNQNQNHTESHTVAETDGPEST